MLEVREYNGIKVDSTWEHTNGNRYTVMLFTNTESQNPKYVPTIVYRGPYGNLWSRPVSDWNRSMKIVKDAYPLPD